MRQNKSAYKRDYTPPSGPELIRVGAARNEHGTRIACRITCISCGAADYVSVRAGHSPRCRACARKELNAFEQGVRPPRNLTQVSCFQCKQSCELPDWLAKKDNPLCKDCAKGFELWRGAIGSTQSSSFEERRSGIVLRRRG